MKLLLSPVVVICGLLIRDHVDYVLDEINWKCNYFDTRNSYKFQIEVIDQVIIAIKDDRNQNTFAFRIFSLEE
jgi:hypothetical protein